MSVDETLVCDHLNEICRAVLSCGTVYYAVQVGPRPYASHGAKRIDDDKLVLTF